MKMIDENKPLPNHTKLDCFECYAKIVLEEMLPEQFADLVLSDKPDLYNKQLDIGVEVTSAENPLQKKAEALYVKWFEQNDNRKRKTEREIEKCGAKLKDGILSGIPGRDNFDRIYEALENKLNKLVSGQYKLFSKQYLFIFSDIYADISMREQALSEMHRICDSFKLKFAAIYVLIPGALYAFDLDRDVTFEMKITSSKQFIQATRARVMVIKAENCLRTNGP